MKKFIVNVSSGTSGGYPSEQYNETSVTIEQYSELLLKISEVNLIDELLKCQFFSCGKCRSFSVKTTPFYNLLKKVVVHSETADIILCGLKKITDIEPWMLDYFDQPDEIKEKIFDNDFNYSELKEAIMSGMLIIEDGAVYKFPYEECSFIFDVTCDCNRMLCS